LSDETSEKQGQIVYGQYRGVNAFIIFDESAAEGLASELEEIEACETVGDARRVRETLGYTYMPGGSDDFLDEDGEPLPDDAPYDCWDTGEAQEGDWPPMPGAYALDDLPLELLRPLTAEAGGRLIDTTVNGSSFAIPLNRQEDLVRILRSAGYEVRRGDDLINSLGVQL
jgi:hypothetical protein